MLVKCVDHLTVRVSPPEPLFNTLTQQLLLPQAWPLNTNPFYRSGGVSLGNMNLEIMQVHRRAYHAALYGIAFDLTPFEQSLPALDQRGLSHTPPLPFYLVDDQGWQVTAWTNVYLGGLWSINPLARLFFTLSQHAPQEVWERGTMPTTFNRRFGRPFVFDRVYKNWMTSAVAYNPVWRAANIHQEGTRPGLELLRVFEVTLGAENFAEARQGWKKLLDPLPELAEGVWQLPEGLHIRLVEAPRDGLLGMIWQVASVNRAAMFLNKQQVIGQEENGRVTIAPEKVGGLNIQLVQ